MNNLKRLTEPSMSEEIARESESERASAREREMGRARKRKMWRENEREIKRREGARREEEV